MRSDLIDITLVLMHETERAVFVCGDDQEEEKAIWLPKSAVEYEDTGKRTRRFHRIVTVTLTESLATEKGLV